MTEEQEAIDALNEFDVVSRPEDSGTGRDSVARRVILAAQKIAGDKAVSVPLSAFGKVKNPISALRFKSHKMKIRLGIFKEGNVLKVWIRR